MSGLMVRDVIIWFYRVDLTIYLSSSALAIEGVDILHAVQYDPQKLV